MRKPNPTAILLLFFFVFWPFLLANSRNSSAQELIAAVNTLRAQNGLPPYQVNPILMAVAQAHAEYMANTGTVTHYSADGSRPFQRALAAGYPVGGDLSLGGFFSENIISGRNMTAEQAVQAWTGDAPHLNTMLADHLTEIGAGVAVRGDVYYYVIDAARPASGPVAYTPVNPQGTPITVAPPVAPVSVTSTPGPDGRLVHVVQAGQTLWTIAAVYGVSLDELRERNNLANDWIQPGQQLVIRPGEAATASPSPSPSETATLPPPPSPTATAARQPSPTLLPANTAAPSPVPSATPPPPRPAVSDAFPFWLLVLAMIIATFVTIVLRKT